jgi:hypothetical protein
MEEMIEENMKILNDVDNKIKRNINVKVKIDTKDLYEFLMHNNYVSFRGVISILFSVMAIIGTILYWKDFSNFYKVFMIVLSMLFTVIVPVEYYIRARRQAKKGFTEEFNYDFDEVGITITRGEESSSLKWSEVMKVVSTKNLVIVYFTPVRAFILPKRSLGNNFEDLKIIMEAKTSCYKFKMNK